MPTKKLTKLEEMEKKGLFNLYSTDAEGTFVLVICTSDKDPIIVPFIKDATGGFAYIATSLRADYAALSKLIAMINSEKIYKDLKDYVAILGDAPAHSKTITRFIQNAGAVKAKTADVALKAAGYTLPEFKEVSTTITKDYSEISKVQSYKELIDDSHKRLVKDNITYDSLSDDFKDAFDDCLKGVTKGVVFAGPSGTGKTKAIEAFADHIVAPMKSVIFNSQTKESDLMGKYIPNPDANSPAKYVFVKGPLLEAATEGFLFVGQEANYMKSNNLIIFNQLLDDTGIIEYNGVTYKVNPNFLCFFTMNCGAKGSEPFYKSLKNRIEAVYIPAQSVDEFSAWIQKAIKASYDIDVPEEFCVELHKFTTMVTKEAMSLHETAEFSVRDAIRVCKAVYAKAHTIEQFTDVLSRNYVNKLSLDYDRGEKIKAFKDSDVFKNSVKKLYSLYNFSVLEEKEPTASLTELLGDGSSTVDILGESDKEDSAVEADMDSILAGLGM